MEMITLTSGQAQAVINPEGAWVEELTSDGQPILFSKTELMSESGDKKARGGMHICLPNFGPGGDSGLPQHGFGRTAIWEVTGQAHSSVTLHLNGSTLDYSHLDVTLEYRLEESSLTATLTLRNTDGVSMRVAPGFHPYFYLEESETAVAVNSTVYDLSSLAGTEFLEGSTMTLQTASRTLSLSSKNLSTYALWTDSLANYVCLEPTFGGYRFLEAPTPEEQLEPNAEKTYSCTINW